MLSHAERALVGTNSFEIDVGLQLVQFLCRGFEVVSRSRHSHLKGGRMIVLQNSNLPLSTDFFTEKKTPIFQNADF